MLPACPIHEPQRLEEGLKIGLIIRKGCYRRTSDRKKIRRFLCKSCGTYFSEATAGPCYRQHKRYINNNVFVLYNSHVTQSRSAAILKVNVKTIARKLVFMGAYLGKRNEQLLDQVQRAEGPFRHVQFDEMETAEHSKCKPLSIPLIVTSNRLILGLDVAVMPAKGRLAEISRKKYGPRADERGQSIERLLQRVRPRIASGAVLRSDECPRYPSVIRRGLPTVVHQTVKGRRSCIAGQGELKKIGFDPLFALNHTAAMLRANVNRLIRRTWCTTKKRERLKDHLTLYMAYHNLSLYKVELCLDL
jgi:hypothetical protein